VPTHTQPRPSAGEEFGSGMWHGHYPPGGHGHYGGSSSCPFGEGGSHSAGAPCSNDEDDGG
jgi:hypothetical protein